MSDAHSGGLLKEAEALRPLVPDNDVAGIYNIVQGRTEHGPSRPATQGSFVGGIPVSAGRSLWRNSRQSS